jgi:hypothetical protein
LAQLTASLQGLASVDAIAEIDIPPGRLPCVVPAFTASIQALGDISTSIGGTLDAQASFVAFLTTGG